LLLDAQPAITTPYTPMLDRAMMKRMPIGRSATTISTRPHGVGSGAANGTTAKVMSAGKMASAGARMK